MSFQLQLTAAVATSPVRLDLAVIEAAMLWPDDERRRAAFREATAIDTIRNWAIEAQDGPVLAELLQRQGSLPDIAAMQPDDSRFVQGTISGKRLLEAVLSAHHSEHQLRLGAIDERIARELKRIYQVEPQTLKNKAGPLTKFRPVAHLWAARLVAAHEGTDSFPCKVADIPRFLGTAEALRALAETTRLPNSHHTVMRPGEAVSLPLDVVTELPKVAFIGRQSFTD